MKYSIVEIADILGVDYHSISNKNATVSQLLTDSRSLTDPEETIFFALFSSGFGNPHTAI